MSLSVSNRVHEGGRTREVDASNYTQLHCRFCDEPLLQGPTAATAATATAGARPIQQVRKLPSAHWAELAELWMCEECGSAIDDVSN